LIDYNRKLGTNGLCLLLKYLEGEDQPRVNMRFELNIEQFLVEVEGTCSQIRHIQNLSLRDLFSPTRSSCQQ
jgi:hypothetical protein